MTRPPLDESQSEKDRRDAEEWVSNPFRQCGEKVIDDIANDCEKRGFIKGRQTCPCRTSSSKSPETLTSSPAIKAPSDLERAREIVTTVIVWARNQAHAESLVAAALAAAREETIPEREALWNVIQEVEEYLGIGRTFLCSDNPLVKAMNKLDRALKKGKP